MSDGSAIATAAAPSPVMPFDPNKTGSRTRLAGMFQAHHAVVWRALRRRGLDPDAAADATQQCFLIAAERLDDIRVESERAFLLGTAMRLALTNFRSNRRWEIGDDPDMRTKPGEGLEEALDQRRSLELLDRALARLTPELLEVFVLFELEEMSTPEIAALIEIPVGTAASRLRRAREGFRDAVSRLERGMRREVTR